MSDECVNQPYHSNHFTVCVVCSVTQSSPAVCYSMDYGPPGSSVLGIHTEVGCHFFLQGIFQTQEPNPDLLHWQVDSLPLSHQGNTISLYTCILNHHIMNLNIHNVISQ